MVKAISDRRAPKSAMTIAMVTGLSVAPSLN